MRKNLLCLMTVVLLAGCASAPKVQFFKQNFEKHPVLIQQLSFEKFQKPSGRQSDAEWNQGFVYSQEMFFKGLKEKYPEIQSTENANDKSRGLLIGVQATQMTHGYNPFTGMHSYLHVQVEMIELSTHDKIAAFEVEGKTSSVGQELNQVYERAAFEAGKKVGKYLADLKE